MPQTHGLWLNILQFITIDVLVYHGNLDQPQPGSHVLSVTSESCLVEEPGLTHRNGCRWHGRCCPPHGLTEASQREAGGQIGPCAIHGTKRSQRLCKGEFASHDHSISSFKLTEGTDGCSQTYTVLLTLNLREVLWKGGRQVLLL